MKGTVATLSLSVTLIALMALGVAYADIPEQAPIPSTYSAPALYNLGNFYARMGRPALAVLNYERARVFAPSDPDVQANLRLVRESVGTPKPTRSWLSQHDRWSNPNVLYWVGLFGLVLAGSSLLLRRATSTHRSALGACAGIGAAAMTLVLADASATSSVLSESVAMYATPASASPISGAEPLFTVPLADVVSVEDKHAGFELIIDSQGHKGWVASRDLQPVITPSGAPREIHKVIRAPAT
jgi:Tfp pilus assembly protein FimV